MAEKSYEDGKPDHMSFASGIGYGTELDKPYSDNDGSAVNVRGFSCEKKHELFCCNLEIFNESSQNDFKNLLKKESPQSSCHSPEDFDSDESLGILPLDILSDKEGEVNESCFDILMIDKSLIHDHEQSFPTNLIIKNALEEKDANLEYVTAASFEAATHSPELLVSLNKTQVIDSPGEQLKMNVTQVIDSPEEQVKMNVTHVIDSSEEQVKMNVTHVIDSSEELLSLNHTQIIHSPELKDNLKATQVIYSIQEQDEMNITYHDHSAKHEFKAVGKSIDKDFALSDYIDHKIFQDFKSGSPFYKTASSPKYSSTPKHETNFTFILDEEFLNPEKNISPVSHLNKTNVKMDVIKEKIVPQNDELNLEKIYSETAALSLDKEEINIFNITCNIEKISDQCEFNKTFTNVFSNAESHSTFKSNNGTFDIKDPAFHEENIKHDKNIQGSVMNTTISLHGELKTFNVEEKIDSNVPVSDSLEKNLDNVECKEDALNITVLLSKEAEESDVAEKNEHDQSQILNTTYEKMDQLTEMPKVMKASEVQKQIGKESRLLKIARKINSDPHSTVTSNSKCIQFDKKKLRKSVFYPSKNDRDELNKQNANRRKTLGNISESDNISYRGHEPSLKYVQKQHHIPCVASDSKSVRIRTSLSCGMPKKCPVKEDIDAKSIKNYHESTELGTKISCASSSSVPLKFEMKQSVERELDKGKISPDAKEKFLLEKKIKSAVTSKGMSSVKPQIPHISFKNIDKSKPPVESELDKGKKNPDETVNTSFDNEKGAKSTITSRRISSIKSEIPSYGCLRRKSAVPISKQIPKVSISTISDEDKNVPVSGLPGKGVLSQRNLPASKSNLDTSYVVTSRGSSLNVTRKSSLSAAIDSNIRKLGSVPSFNNKGENKGAISSVNQSRSGLLISTKIPSYGSKKDTEEKSDSKPPASGKSKLKKSSHYNLR